MLLFETLSQPFSFLVIFSIGFASGFLFDFRMFLHFLLNKNKIVEVILDIVFSLLACFVFFISCINVNHGEFRFFLILAFCFGLFLQRISLGRLIAKISGKWYISFRKFISKIDYGKFKKKKKQKNINS